MLRFATSHVGMEGLRERAHVEDVRYCGGATCGHCGHVCLDVEPRKLSLGQLLQLVVDVGAHAAASDT